MSKRNESAPQFKTLSPLIRFFIGLELRIELKNGKSYHGFLNDSDDDMNIVLGGIDINTMNASKCHQKEVEEKAEGTNKFTNRGSSQALTASSSSLGEFQFSKLHIRGSSIRFIHFPNNADLSVLIKID